MKYSILALFLLLLTACPNLEPTQNTTAKPTPEATTVPFPTLDRELQIIVEDIQRGVPPAAPLSAAASGCQMFGELARSLEIRIVEYRPIGESAALKSEIYFEIWDIRTAFGDDVRFSNAAHALGNAVGGPQRKANFDNGLLAGRHLARLCRAARHESPSNPDIVIEFVCRGSDLDQQASGISETFFNLVVHPCAPD